MDFYLDDDVAALLVRAQKARQASRNAIVNESLRYGLNRILARQQRRKRFATKSVGLGRSLVGSLDDVAGILYAAEAQSFK